MIKQLWMVLAVLAAAGAFLFFEPHQSKASGAENFRLYTSNGRLVSLDEHLGKVVVLDFYASWCQPCRRSMPEIERLHDAYRDRGVVFYAVNLRDTEDAAGFAREVGISYPVLLHGEKVAEAYGVTSIPTLIVISPDGRIVFRQSGWDPKAFDELAEVIDEQLTENSR